jgi:hypothetical protein
MAPSPIHDRGASQHKANLLVGHLVLETKMSDWTAKTLQRLIPRKCSQSHSQSVCAAISLAHDYLRWGGYLNISPPCARSQRVVRAVAHRSAGKMAKSMMTQPISNVLRYARASWR